MWSYKFLSRIDIRLVFVLLIIMGISLSVISSTTMEAELAGEIFFTSFVKSQLMWFLFGWIIFLFFAGFDYHKFCEGIWIFYGITLLLLFGLFFTSPIHSVHRWYRVPFVGIYFQPSEYAKLVVVLTLGWFMEKNQHHLHRFSSALRIFFIVGIPFLLILKEPDLGTAMVLYPITLVMCYFGGVHRKSTKFLFVMGIIGLTFISSVFSGILSHEKMKPFFTSFMKEYQYERLNPNSYHQRCSENSIAIGGLTGSGFQKSEFASRRWLPAAHTDSVFAAFGEEFGLIGMVFLLSLFYALIYFCFQVVAVAKDHFGRLLSSGIAIYLAMHIIVNIAEMCGFVPVAGVPLILVTYGGSSVVTTMAALGMLQSVYVRRFMF